MKQKFETQTENVGEVSRKMDNDHLIAVIAAAVATFLGTSPENVVLTSVKPLQQKSNWAEQGLKNQMASRL